MLLPTGDRFRPQCSGLVPSAINWAFSYGTRYKGGKSRKGEKYKQSEGERKTHTQRTRDTQRAMWDGILVENARERGNTNIKNDTSEDKNKRMTDVKRNCIE